MTAPAQELRLRITAMNEAGQVFDLTQQDVERLAGTIRASSSEADVAIAALSGRAQQLQADLALDKISAEGASEAFRTLKADAAGLAATTQLTGTQQDRLAGIARGAGAQVMSLSRAEIRAVGSAEALGAATIGLTGIMQGNAAAVGGLTAAMQRFAIGSTRVVAALGIIGAAVGVGIVLYQALAGAARKAAEEEQRAHEGLAARIGGVRASGQERVDALRALAASERARGAALRDVAVPTLQTTETRLGGRVAVNAAEVAAARRTNAENERQRQIARDAAQIADTEVAEAERALARSRANDARDRARRAAEVQAERQRDFEVVAKAEQERARQEAERARLEEASRISPRGLPGFRPFQGPELGIVQEAATLDLRGQLAGVASGYKEASDALVTFSLSGKSAREELANLAGGTVDFLEAGLIDAVVDSLGQGARGLRGFGKQVAAVMGGALVSMGKGVIGIGLGSKALKEALTNIFGGGGLAAIAIGGGMILLGNAIRGLARDTGEQLSSGFGGGGAGGGGGGFDSGGLGGSVPRGNITLNVPRELYTAAHAVDWLAEVLRQMGDRNVQVHVT